MSKENEIIQIKLEDHIDGTRIKNVESIILKKIEEKKKIFQKEKRKEEQSIIEEFSKKNNFESIKKEIEKYDNEIKELQSKRSELIEKINSFYGRDGSYSLSNNPTEGSIIDLEIKSKSTFSKNADELKKIEEMLPNIWLLKNADELISFYSEMMIKIEGEENE